MTIAIAVTALVLLAVFLVMLGKYLAKVERYGIDERPENLMHTGYDEADFAAAEAALLAKLKKEADEEGK